jgi:GMP synthase-like glutamine amidotransferase
MNQPTIGILVTNTDRSSFAAGWPRDGEKFSTLLRNVRPLWRFKIYDCTISEFPKSAGECNGYIIGGSPASVNDEAAWIDELFFFIRTLNGQSVPTIGCCFGHQAIAKALGGTVRRNPDGWGLGVSTTHFMTHEPWMIPERQTLRLFAAHSEQVTTLPESAHVLGGDAFCPIGSFAIGQHIFTTEYHPEMSKPFFVALTRAFQSYVGDDVAVAARQQADASPDDGHIFAQWIVNFLEQNWSTGRSIDRSPL